MMASFEQDEVEARTGVGAPRPEATAPVRLVRGAGSPAPVRPAILGVSHELQGLALGLAELDEDGEFHFAEGQELLHIPTFPADPDADRLYQMVRSHAAPEGLDPESFRSAVAQLSEGPDLVGTALRGNLALARERAELAEHLAKVEDDFRRRGETASYTVLAGEMLFQQRLLRATGESVLASPRTPEITLEATATVRLHDGEEVLLGIGTGRDGLPRMGVAEPAPEGTYRFREDEEHHPTRTHGFEVWSAQQRLDAPEGGGKSGLAYISDTGAAAVSSRDLGDALEGWAAAGVPSAILARQGIDRFVEQGLRDELERLEEWTEPQEQAPLEQVAEPELPDHFPVQQSVPLRFRGADGEPATLYLGLAQDVQGRVRIGIVDEEAFEVPALHAADAVPLEGEGAVDLRAVLDPSRAAADRVVALDSPLGRVRVPGEGMRATLRAWERNGGHPSAAGVLTRALASQGITPEQLAPPAPAKAAAPARSARRSTPALQTEPEQEDSLSL